jgi:hypothetical protein
MSALVNRLRDVSRILRGPSTDSAGSPQPLGAAEEFEEASVIMGEQTLAEQMLSRMERQTGVLSRVAASIVAEAYVQQPESSPAKSNR